MIRQNLPSSHERPSRNHSARGRAQRRDAVRAGRPLAHLAVIVLAFAVSLLGLLSSALGISDRTISSTELKGTLDEEMQAMSRPIEITPTPAATATATPAVSSPGAGTASSYAAIEPSATPEPSPCEQHASGLYCVYTVRPGDTLSTIASRFGLVASGELSPADLLAESNQPAVAEANSIAPGLQLRIPAEVGIIHTVLVPETTTSVAQRYGVEPAQIQALPSNGLAQAGELSVGRELLVPNPAYVADPAPPAEVAPLASATEDLAQASADIEVPLDAGPVAEQEEARPGGPGTADSPTETPEAAPAEASSETEEDEQDDGSSDDEGTPTAAAETATPPPTAAVTAAVEPRAGFQAGEKVLVATDNGDCLRVREGPGLSHAKIDCIKNGSNLTLGAGPSSADGHQWWQLAGRKGFVAGEFLRSERLKPGDSVVVATDTGDCLRVREAPGLSQPRTACLRNGAQLTLGAGPVEADGHQWWQIDGRAGVVSGTYLRYEEPRRSSSAGFIWPASGPITSRMGPGHPKGIDIGFRHDPNQPVVATAAGKVTFVGGNACCSYGYYVTVDHGGGWSSLYAHFSSFAPGLKAGDTVSQGQLLGYGGTTGFSTGYHLHFEMLYNGAHVNPLNYLPAD